MPPFFPICKRIHTILELSAEIGVWGLMYTSLDCIFEGNEMNEMEGHRKSSFLWREK